MNPSLREDDLDRIRDLERGIADLRVEVGTFGASVNASLEQLKESVGQINEGMKTMQAHETRIAKLESSSGTWKISKRKVYMWIAGVIAALLTGVATAKIAHSEPYYPMRLTTFQAKIVDSNGSEEFVNEMPSPYDKPKKILDKAGWTCMLQPRKFNTEGVTERVDCQTGGPFPVKVAATTYCLSGTEDQDVQRLELGGTYQAVAVNLSCRTALTYLP